jgi:hypothetical protein
MHVTIEVDEQLPADAVYVRATTGTTSSVRITMAPSVGPHVLACLEPQLAMAVADALDGADRGGA